MTKEARARSTRRNEVKAWSAQQDGRAVYTTKAIRKWQRLRNKSGQATWIKYLRMMAEATPPDAKDAAVLRAAADVLEALL